MHPGSLLPAIELPLNCYYTALENLNACAEGLRVEELLIPVRLSGVHAQHRAG